MKKIFELLVVFILSWEELQAEEYVIIQRQRSIGTGSTLKAQPDRFTIPSTLCKGDGSTQCEQMRASRVRNCTCECNRTSSESGDLSSSTFGLDHEGRWTCLENAEVHELSGCSIILNNWRNDSPLITTPNAGIASYEIPTQFRNFHIHKGFSNFQQCNGNWKHLDYITYVKERFYVYHNKTDNKRYLKFNYSSNPSSTLMAGRVIELGGGYYTDPNNTIELTCILLKVQGRRRCLFSLPSTTTAYTTQPSVFSSLARNTLSTSTGSVTKPKTHITSSSSHTVTMATGKTSVPMVINTNAQNTNSDDHTTGMIAGAVAGVIGLFALVIVIVLVRRRKKRNTIEKRTDVAAENIGYGTNRVERPLEEGEDYSYAYASAVSINKLDQQPKNKGAQNVENASNCKNVSVPDSPTKIGYILKEPEYATVNIATNQHDEPLYRVLKGPESEGPDGNEPPCYHVLEGPYPDSGPFYDVLEEPNSTARLANQDDVQTTPNLKQEVEGDRGYNDTVYDCVEEIIPDTGHIYQQLNQDGQREPSVYQALTNGTPLTKLNATDSEA